MIFKKFLLWNNFTNRKAGCLKMWFLPIYPSLQAVSGHGLSASSPFPSGSRLHTCHFTVACLCAQNTGFSPLFSFRDRVGCMAQTGLKLFLLPLLTESWDHRLMSPCRAGSGTREHGHCHCHTRCCPFLGFRTIITMGLHFPPPLTGFLCRMGLLFKIYFKFI